VAQGAKVTFTNKCTYTVWPVTLTGDKKPQLSTTGFELASGASNSVDIPSPYSRVRSGLKPNAPTTTEGSTAPLLTAPPVKSHAMVPVQSRRQPRQKLPLQKTEDKISMRWANPAYIHWIRQTKLLYINCVSAMSYMLLCCTSFGFCFSISYASLTKFFFY